MSSFNPLKAVYHMESLGLKSNITSPGNLFYYRRGLDVPKPELPVLVLLHGYPQSNFMWRHVVPLLPPEIPLFIPDLPGYGRSQPLKGPHDKRSVGNEILRVLSTLVASKEKLPIILAGHDRGARVSYRLSVDNDSPKFIIKGTILLDIMQTIVQWASFANPTIASFAFHWPLLANVEQATAMIKAYGGAEWAKSAMRRWGGKSEAGIASLEEHNALEIYGEFFENESVIRASCDDYRAGAFEDIDEEKKDQESGRKLPVPTMLIYSEDYLGKRYDMVKIWSEWINDKNLLEDVPIGDGCGHFVAEEAPQKTATAISRFYSKFV